MNTGNFKKMLHRVPLFLFLALMIPAVAGATGPRVTGSLFAVDKSEIYAVDIVPFISMEVAGGGIATEISDAALAAGEIDVVITTLPLQRMVRYYLSQENAIAVMGHHFKFSKADGKSLIFVPVVAAPERHYYYRGSYPDGLAWKGDLKNMKGKRYGSHPGEDNTAYNEAGIEVVHGRTMSLLKKLKSGKIDFIGVPSLSVEWLIKKYMPEEKGNFVVMEIADYDDEIIYVIFNRKHADGVAAAEKFRKALTKMIADGSYLEILKGHMDEQRAEGYLKRIQYHQK
ncbi:MAG: ABC transporter substrate-binding protein [Mariprofundaceae bacterium]